MKPKDLKPPFTFEERKVYLDEDQKILYIPPRVERKNLKENLQKIFSPFKKICLEYCSGNGEWIHKRASNCPDILWIGVEKQFKRVRKIWSKAKNSELNNLLIVCGEAQEFSKYYLSDNEIDEIYINFPDPWPKKKHAKFRLMQPDFISQLARVLKPQGEVHFVTDDKPYSSQSIEALLGEEKLISLFQKPFYTDEIENYGSSYFLRLWMEKKRSFYFSKFQKTCKY